VNSHEKAPVLPAVSEPVEQLLIATPSNTSDVRVVETENPDPEAVTVAPTGPFPGVAESVRAVTVNDPIAD
jgi:hypothetical protein